MDVLTAKQDDWDAYKITHTFSPEVLGELNLITFDYIYTVCFFKQNYGEKYQYD